jgi:hypothetical protein
MHDLRSSHLDAMNRILRYLKSCLGKGILFSNHGHLKGYMLTGLSVWMIEDLRQDTVYSQVIILLVREAKNRV